jgi:hypothetical protein
VSTRFKDYETYVKARQAAFAAVNNDAHIDPVNNQITHPAVAPLPPNATLGASRTVQFVDRSVPPKPARIDEGFRGTGAADANGNYPDAQHEAVSGITGATMTVQWYPHMQRVIPAQLFPNGASWDQGNQKYPAPLQTTAPL